MACPQATPAKSTTSGTSQNQGKGQDSHTHQRVGCLRVGGGGRRVAGRADSRDVRLSDYSGSRTAHESGECPGRRHCSPEQNGGGTCPEPCHPALGADDSSSRELQRESCCRAIEQIRSNMCIDSLLHGKCWTETSMTKEKRKLNCLIRKMEHELTDMEQTVKTSSNQVDLVEVFCENNSPLTNAINQTRGKAIRFGMAQGDLETRDGRCELFRIIINSQPRNIWFSPECGPWSAWPSLNASRSQEAHQKVQDLRGALLPQVAQGIVLFRYQIARNKHLHWEQPPRSQMVNLPHLQEVHERTLAATFDMCRMGDLRDPISQQPMRKMIILTTSQRLFDELHGRNCRCTTSHQEIAGSIRYADGTSVLRAKFTAIARYPRKFARLIAKILRHKLCQTETPYCDPHLAQMYSECFGTEQADEPARNGHRRLSLPQKPRLVDPVDDPAEAGKRRRLDNKQAVEQLWHVNNWSNK